MPCSTEVRQLLSKAHARPVTGVNIGGWLVLEPWITPSLFYQFLGAATPETTGMDTSSFCRALGPVEGNKQLRRCILYG